MRVERVIKRIVLLYSQLCRRGYGTLNFAGEGMVLSLNTLLSQCVALSRTVQSRFYAVCVSLSLSTLSYKTLLVLNTLLVLLPPPTLLSTALSCAGESRVAGERRETDE